MHTMANAMTGNRGLKLTHSDGYSGHLSKVAELSEPEKETEPCVGGGLAEEPLSEICSPEAGWTVSRGGICPQVTEENWPADRSWLVSSGLCPQLTEERWPAEDPWTVSKICSQLTEETWPAEASWTVPNSICPQLTEESWPTALSKKEEESLPVTSHTTPPARLQVTEEHWPVRSTSRPQAAEEPWHVQSNAPARRQIPNSVRPQAAEQGHPLPMSIQQQATEEFSPFWQDTLSRLGSLLADAPRRTIQESPVAKAPSLASMLPDYPPAATVPQRAACPHISQDSLRAWLDTYAAIDAPCAQEPQGYVAAPHAPGRVWGSEASCSQQRAAPPSRMQQPMELPARRSPAVDSSGFDSADALAAASGTSNLMLSWANIHTVMMQNMPNQVTQKMLLAELDESGFAKVYDFVYLPICADTKANRGYAFINFVHPGLALMFRMHFDGQRKFANCHTDKALSVAPATLQGYDANYEHFSGTRVKHREHAARPLFLRDKLLGKAQKKARHKPDSLIDLVAAQMKAQQQEEQSQEASGSMLGSRSASAKPASKVPKFCPYCGGARQADFKFCSFCGATVCLGAC